MDDSDTERWKGIQSAHLRDVEPLSTAILRRMPPTPSLFPAFFLLFVEAVVGNVRLVIILGHGVGEAGLCHLVLVLG